MTYEERAHRRIEAVRKKEEDLLRLERARYSVQELMYEAEEVLRAAVQRVSRSGLPPTMVKAVERAFSSVNDAVRTVEVADLRSRFPAHPESRRAPIKPSALAQTQPEPEPAQVNGTAPARAEKRPAKAATHQPKRREAEAAEQALVARAKAEPPEGKKTRAAGKTSPGPERAKAGPAETSKAREEPRRTRKPAAAAPVDQPQLPLVDLPATPAGQTVPEMQPAPPRERRKAAAAVG